MKVRITYTAEVTVTVNGRWDDACSLRQTVDQARSKAVDALRGLDTLPPGINVTPLQVDTVTLETSE